METQEHGASVAQYQSTAVTEGDASRRISDASQLRQRDITQRGQAPA